MFNPLAYIKVFMLFCSFIVFAHADVTEPIAGTIEAKVDGQVLIFPSLKTDVRADIQGDLVNVKVIQTFANPTSHPLNVEYVFPLNGDAAVHRMHMQVGDTAFEAVIKQTQEAESLYTAAKKSGKNAALLIQHRPNMFTQSIANLMPDLPITVTLEYVHTIPKVDGAYELVIPLVVGPRYTPQQPEAGDMLIEEHPISTESGVWHVELLPAYPPTAGVDIPQNVAADRVNVSIHLNSGIAIQSVDSQTHALDIQDIDPTQKVLTLSKGRVQDNRDFVLRYALQGQQTEAGLLAHRDDRGGFLSLHIEPPAILNDDDIAAREMVFVLDCSGSMHGLPMQASKAFMRQSLSTLRPTDYFRIIRFSAHANEFSRQPLLASENNLRDAMAYVETLRGQGSTEMIRGIELALNAPVISNTRRNIVFLTDGYIGNEVNILSLLNRRLADARLYAFGVGTAVNRFLLDEMGRIGRGFTHYMDPTESVETVAQGMAARLQSPVLTHIHIDWGTLEVAGVLPQLIPDLFAGQSLRIQARYATPGTYTITVKGQVNGRAATLPLTVTLPEKSEHGKAIALVWARSQIKQTMHERLAPLSLRPANRPDQVLQQEVTQLGLDFGLVTEWTSFVAVSDFVANTQGDQTRDAQIPVPKVAGVSNKAYPSSGGFSGAPEPASVFGLLLVMLMIAWHMMKNGRWPEARRGG